jgi:hypothetical protein
VLFARASKPGFTADGSRRAEALLRNTIRLICRVSSWSSTTSTTGRTFVALHAIHAGNTVVESSQDTAREMTAVKRLM